MVLSKICFSFEANIYEMDIYYDLNWFDNFVKNYSMSEEEKLSEQNFVLLMASCLAMQTECWMEAFATTHGLKEKAKFRINNAIKGLKYLNKYFDIEYKKADPGMLKLHFETSVTFAAALKKIHECPEEKTHLLELIKAYSEGTLKLETK